MQEVKVEMELIEDPNSVPETVHGTYLEAWQFIREQGLCKMKRQHIHLATGVYGDQAVISGMRGNVQVLVYVDIAKAMQDGIAFHKSANGVVLTEGNAEGYLLPKYFAKAINIATKEELNFVR
jgi:2'-phosphotransferase